VEHGVAMTFKRGTDEWFVVMDEYDRQERKHSVEEQRRRANKSENLNEVPF
jgi:hypothetical protein